MTIKTITKASTKTSKITKNPKITKQMLVYKQVQEDGKSKQLFTKLTRFVII